MSTSAKVFLAGHSLGGAMVPVFAKDNQKLLTGLIQFGAYLTRDTRD
jgi:alpha-beta hydrolase superfamily lysophospholipase